MNVEEVSEEDLFNEAVSDETPDDPVVTEQSDQPEREVARDEAGRFAAKEEPEAEVVSEQVEKPAVDDNAPLIPSWRLREIREERDEFKRQLEEARRQPAAQPKQEVQPEKTEAPDPLLDPAGYAKHVRDEIRNEILAERREESLQKAANDHPEEFAEAYKAAQQVIDPALRARMQSSRDPGKTLLEWHRENKVKQEVGNDPNAWLEKKLEERLKDPAFLAKALEAARTTAQPQSNGRPRVELPPTLNGASRSNAMLRSANNDISDEELFREVAG
jgi:hypothetical protein